MRLKLHVPPAVVLDRQTQAVRMPVIDIHAHYVAPELITEAEKDGDRYGVRLVRDSSGQKLVIGDTPPLRPFFIELCDLKTRLPQLDAQGVDRQVISTWTDLSGDELPPDQGARWARLQNETLAATASAMPDRFTAMGILPMQNTDLALAEIDYLVDRLGVRSVEIGTNINGRELDHPELRAVWRHLANRDVFVLLHPPRMPVGIARGGDYFLNNLVLYPADTTLAAGRLIFSGIMRDNPKLKICLAHAGGFLPYQIGRFDRGSKVHPACKQELRQAPSAFLGRFYYDTLTHHGPALGYLVGLVGAERLLFGSDSPFEMLDAAGPKRIEQLNLSSTVTGSILGGNAAQLI